MTSSTGAWMCDTLADIACNDDFEETEHWGGFAPSNVILDMEESISSSFKQTAKLAKKDKNKGAQPSDGLRPQRSFYAGEQEGELKHGRGKYTYSDGTVYEGQWHQNLKHGAGVETFGQDSRYEGQFWCGRRHGNGRLVSASDCYEGQFVRDELEGTGHFTFQNGCVYAGQVSKGEMHGLGRLDLPDGSAYEGGFEAGRRHGKGVVMDKAGRSHAGIWHRGEQSLKISL
mmetsp:Transcript_20495/g.36833  ORF Transcript_20495/g.36833 Transcript_20495/m.36833 type:complete len:229 (-) Transcript_20495:38-724(-)